jgi:hypothetical protein
VTAVKPGSPAALSGMLQTGDVLTVVNGIPLRTTDRDRARELLDAAGEMLQITVAGTVPSHVLEALVSDRARHLSPESKTHHVRVLVWAGRLLRLPVVALACALLFFVGIGEGIARMLRFAVVKLWTNNNNMHPPEENWNFDLAMWLWCVCSRGDEVCSVKTKGGRRSSQRVSCSISRYRVFLKVDDDGRQDQSAKELDVREWLRMMPTEVGRGVAELQGNTCLANVRRTF